MKVLDLFSGIGGFSLGLERAGMETVAFCEIETYCQKVLKKHWPNTPIFEDIKELYSHYMPEFDVICGGFPCQPFSTASHGIKTAENLWPFMLDTIEFFLPEYVIAENVQEKPIFKAQQDLEKLGYKCERRNIKATDCGADHKRSRWWLIAHTDNEGQLSSAIDAEVAKLPELCESLWGAENYSRAIRVPYGVSHRMDRLKQLGNTVIPQIPQAIGRAIMGIQSEKE